MVICDTQDQAILGVARIADYVLSKPKSNHTVQYQYRLVQRLTYFQICRMPSLFLTDLLSFSCKDLACTNIPDCTDRLAPSECVNATTRMVVECY